MSMRRGRLTTIYSVGEGRTIVFASDGCKNCTQAFSVLVNTAQQTESEDDVAKREQIADDLGRRALSLNSNLRDDGNSGDAKSSSLGAVRAPGTPKASREKGVNEKPLSAIPGSKVSGQARRRTPQQDLPSILDVAALKAVQSETSPTKKGGTPRQKAAPKLRHLVVLDAEVPEEDREEQELTLRSTDRLIVAMYTPPWHVPLPQLQHTTSPKSFKLSQLQSSFNGFLGIRKLNKSDSNSRNSHEDGSSQKAKAEGPKQGPGRTTIFMPMTPWEDVLSAVGQWDNSTQRDGLTTMASTARDAKVRFEALSVESRHSSSDKDNAREHPKGPHLHLPGAPELLAGPKKQSAAMGDALDHLCQEVEAKMLVMGLHHSTPTLDFNHKSFTQHLMEYCAESCKCSVRIVAMDQFKEDSPRGKAPKTP